MAASGRCAILLAPLDTLFEVHDALLESCPLMLASCLSPDALLLDPSAFDKERLLVCGLLLSLSLFGFGKGCCSSLSASGASSPVIF